MQVRYKMAAKNTIVNTLCALFVLSSVVVWRAGGGAYSLTLSITPLEVAAVWPG